MLFRRNNAFFRTCIAAFAFAAAQAHAFPIGPFPTPVVEFYNGITGHYFLSADPQETAAIEAGAAGAGWVRTGYSFNAEAFGTFTYCPGSTGCVSLPVDRFYAPGPNSHFYTANPVESAILRGPSGWIYEKVAFRIPVPDSAGLCQSPTSPVYRFYNGRAAQNDSNHRFVVTEEARQRMIARGWIPEGVAFCAFGASDTPHFVRYFTSSAVADTLANCALEEIGYASCMAYRNLPIPNAVFSVNDPNPFFERTGHDYGLVTGELFLSNEVAARRSFFQPGPSSTQLGFHASTISRGPEGLTSVSPFVKLRTTPRAGASSDERFFPFTTTTYDTETDLRLAFTLFVKSLETAASAGTAARNCS